MRSKQYHIASRIGKEHSKNNLVGHVAVYYSHQMRPSETILASNDVNNVNLGGLKFARGAEGIS